MQSCGAGPGGGGLFSAGSSKRVSGRPTWGAKRNLASFRARRPALELGGDCATLACCRSWLTDCALPGAREPSTLDVCVLSALLGLRRAHRLRAWPGEAVAGASYCHGQKVTQLLWLA